LELHLGNCLHILPTLQGQVDMVLCDLPYGTTQCAWDEPLPLSVMWAALRPLLRPTTPVLLFGAEPFASTLRLSNTGSFKYDWVWFKPRASGFLNAKKQPLRNHEAISVFYEKQPTYNPQKTGGHVRKVAKRGTHLQSEVYGKTNSESSYDSTERYPQSVIEFSSDVQKDALHPTQKPVALCEYLIRTYTNPGDTVLDFTMGSGTTGVAAKNTGREFIGIEVDCGYFEIAQSRIEQTKEIAHDGQSAAGGAEALRAIYRST